MGLTIHYRLKHTGADPGACKLVEQLHQAAGELPFKELKPINHLRGDECQLDQQAQDESLRWLLVQAAGTVKIDERNSRRIPPVQVVAFEAWPGEGCEPANIGLCRYPSFIQHQNKRLPTGLEGWQWRSFCKTQYASDPSYGGMGNFMLCHLLVIALLDKAAELGCLESVHDEGGFWNNRNLKDLAKQVGDWNKFVAAFAGQLQDAVGEKLKTPITDFPNFEELELAGQSTLTPQTAQLAKLIQRFVRQ